MYPYGNNNNSQGFNNPYPYPQQQQSQQPPYLGQQQQQQQQPYPGQPMGMPTPDFNVNYASQGASGGYPQSFNPYGYQSQPPLNYNAYPAYEQNEQYNRLYGQNSSNSQQIPNPYPPQMPTSNSYGAPIGTYNQPGNTGYNPIPPYNPPTYPTDNVNALNTRPSVYPDLSQYNAQVPPAPTYQPAQPTQMTRPTFEGTVKPHAPFNPLDDAEKLYKAMKGMGTNETVLIDILCRRTAQQRMQIASSFKTGYGKDLIENVKKETSGNLHDLLKCLLMRPDEFAAYEIYKAIEGVGTDEIALIDVLCSKSNQEMKEIKLAYKRMYGRDMENAVKNDVSGYFKRLLISLMNADRLDLPADLNRAREQARELKSAGVGRLGTDEVKFNRIFAAESYEQLRAIFDEYYKLTGQDIEKAIRNEMSGDVCNAFVAVAKIAKYAPRYFAERLGKSMIGMGTHDHTLIRNIILRCEIDMREIKMEFQKIYSKSLESFIKNDCSGDYKRALLCLIGDSNWK